MASRPVSRQFGGTEVGASLTPLGATDYSSYLIKAQAANPDVIIFLTAGQDAVNSLKQAVQFGLDKRFHIAGAQQELEVLKACRPRRASAPGCSSGIGTSRTCRTSTSSSPRSRSGPAARCRRRGTGSATPRHGPARLSPTRRRRSTRSSWPRRSKDFKLPPEVALMPNKTFYRAGDHQLMPTLYVGHAVSKGASDPEDLFVSIRSSRASMRRCRSPRPAAISNGRLSTLALRDRRRPSTGASRQLGMRDFDGPRIPHPSAAAGKARREQSRDARRMSVAA